MDMITKACTKCGQVLPLSEYHLHRKRKDGRTARCKECAKRIAREWHQANREQHIESMSRYQLLDPCLNISRQATYRKIH